MTESLIVLTNIILALVTTAEVINNWHRDNALVAIVKAFTSRRTHRHHHGEHHEEVSDR